MPRKKSGNFDEVKYKSEYNKSNYFNVAIRIRKDNAKVIDKLNSVKSKNAYIIDLIEKDLNK